MTKRFVASVRELRRALGSGVHSIGCCQKWLILPIATLLNFMGKKERMPPNSNKDKQKKISHIVAGRRGNCSWNLQGDHDFVHSMLN